MSPKRDPRRPSKPVSVPRSRPQAQPSAPTTPAYVGVASGQGAPVVMAPEDTMGMADVVDTVPQRRGLKGMVLFRWIGSWQFVLLTALALLTGTLAFAITSLFRMPNLPNCRAIFWPTASAAMRLQCADSYAGQGNVEFLLEAIDLVEQLADDHPLRAEINAKVETWSSQILDLADTQFHQGDLDAAIATANKIPTNTAAADSVKSSIRRWQQIWDEGSGLFETAKTKLIDGNFKDAFSLSVRLLDISNDHWSETKYNELTKLIGLAREDSRKLDKVKRLAAKKSISGFEEALKLLNSIRPESVLHGEAKELKKTLAKDMLAVAEAALARKQLDRAEEILAAIPRDEGFNQEIADFQVFTEAYRRAWSGDVLGLDAAINRLQSLGKDRPLYDRAQALIGRWRSELKALAQLESARQLAARGGVGDLRLAINAAQQVDRNNPRWDEVSGQIGRWQARVETTEDQPILNQADRIAATGTPQALKLAIREARKIQSGRTLSGEAQGRIGRWNSRIEAIEDRPLVDLARQQAANGDLASAIATASRISPERSLYGEVKNDLDSWREQRENQTRLQTANSRARAGTANDLASAIATAGQIPSSSSQYATATQQINRWSWDLFRLAEGESRNSLGRAIDLAAQIPSQAEAYATAQKSIQTWEQQQTDRVAPPLILAPPQDPESPAPAPSPAPVFSNTTNTTSDPLGDEDPSLSP